MNDTPQEKRAFVILMVALLFFVSLPSLAWLPQPGTLYSATLLLRIAVSILSISVGIIWLALNRRYPRLLSWLVDLSGEQQRRFDRIALHVLAPSSIACADLLIWFFSEQMHTEPLTRNVVLAVITLAGMAWWIAGSLFPDYLERKVNDYAYNIAAIFIGVLIAWLFSPVVHALILTVLAVIWLVLIRVFPWLPQYRLKRDRRRR